MVVLTGVALAVPAVWQRVDHERAEAAIILVIASAPVTALLSGAGVVLALRGVRRLEDVPRQGGEKILRRATTAALVTALPLTVVSCGVIVLSGAGHLLHQGFSS